MKNMKISEKLQMSVMNYLKDSQQYLDVQRELDTFLTTISPNIKLEVIEYMFSRCMINQFDGIGPLTEQKKVVAFVNRIMTTKIFMPEDYIIRQGDESDRLYF
jgi:hypothetical protein